MRAENTRKKCKFVFLKKTDGKIAKLNLIKQYIQEYQLKKVYRNNPRDVRMVNFESIKTVGLLSNPKTKMEMDQMDKVVKDLQELGKKIYPLIYFEKQIENDIYAKNIDWSGFGKDNCNWFGKPKSDINLNRFISKEFDILIDLSFAEIYSLQYVFVRSKARLKIMPTNSFSKQFADLMLEALQSHDKLTFTKELIHYLEIINKNQQ